ncbi:hypothetical protein DPMN_156704 [Dreissena polymorpha]|uniref:Mab-21-like HhH/H2TH-like domain-containing protein n=1 Tax=Dreissena polymorpha TaxID=45954 RepID=A0A9D4FU13_DREPO|nr:hypothetical protein DPMN_156704 [Dreissena polymorpha]
MTRLGYGEVMRRWRIERQKQMEMIINARPNSATHITAGSKAEGLTSLLQGDWDWLVQLKGVLCVEDGINLHTIPENTDVFRMDTSVYPGYCRLLQEGPAQKHRIELRNALFDNGNGDILLSSSLYLGTYAETVSKLIKQFTPLPLANHAPAGPALPMTMGGILHMDIVPSLRCHCPSILQRWAVRPRHWPPPLIVQKVISLESNVTPVGFKESENKHLEWRLCFNSGETELIKNLNETQAKVYVMLKMILKEILKPKNKEITSYLLKNIILWQAENNPQTEFHARSFIHWLQDGLKELRTAIETKQQRYYMIPERNLMAACNLEGALQDKWVADITDLEEEGPSVILRLPKIRKAIIASPEPMLWFSCKRMELEMLSIEYIKRGLQCTDENKEVDESDFIFNAIRTRMQERFTEVRERMHREGSSLQNLTEMFT